jgi:twitching motility protein PilT
MSQTAAPAPPASDSRRIDRFLHLMLERGASDLHLSVGRPPMFRLSGEVDPIRYRTLSQSDFEATMKPITPPRLWAEWAEQGDADFAYQLGEESRFRVNLSCSSKSGAPARCSA